MTKPMLPMFSLMALLVSPLACDDDAMSDDGATTSAQTDDPPMEETGESGDETSAMQETAGGSERFEDVVTASGMQALLDGQTMLLWVNDVQACNPLGAPTTDTPMIAMQYCDGLEFAGFDDWRMPTVDEASELITAAIDEGVDLMYANPGCPAVIASGGAAVVTHNGEQPGTVTQMPPSVGIRCVRSEG